MQGYRYRILHQMNQWPLAWWSPADQLAPLRRSAPQYEWTSAKSCLSSTRLRMSSMVTRAAA